MTIRLEKALRAASEREWNDDHLSGIEKMKLIALIRKDDNVSDEVPSEQLYEEYVIEK